ncbi:MAG: hypothetical protein HOQ24_07875 [Mycobacteriaceae bacterium]|nr:hypothetical protein [Mycobacteriaceae bacterium]
MRRTGDRTSRRWIVAGLILAGWLLAFGATECALVAADHAGHPSATHHHSASTAAAPGHSHVGGHTADIAAHVSHAAALTSVRPRPDVIPQLLVAAAVLIGLLGTAAAATRGPPALAPAPARGRDILHRFCISRR